MGQTTPNMGIYIPAAGETNYDQSFAAGLVNVDQHDHSGGPNKGVPITTAGLSPGSVTYDKLNANVVDPTTGIGTSGTLPNQLEILGLLKNIYQIPTTAGFISKDGILAHARTFDDTATLQWTNPDGVGGNPKADVLIAGLSPVGVANGGTGLTSMTPYAIVIGGTGATTPLQQVASVGNAGEVLVSQGAALPPVWGGTTQQIASVTLTGAQMRALKVTPIQIVAAPGAGKVLVPIVCYALLTSDGTAFTISAGPAFSQVSISYNSVSAATSFSTQAFINATTDVYTWSTQSTLATIGGIAKADVQNQPLTLFNFNNAFVGGGNSTITFVLSYLTITL